MIKQGIDSLEKWVTLTVDQLNALPGFSDDGTKAVGIVDGIKKVRPVIKALLEAGIEIEAVAQEPAVNPNGPLVGKIFVFTGALPSGTARSVAWDLTRQAGGQIKDSMTKGVTYLVCASPDSTSSKTIKAKRYGIKCISEEDWQKMLKDGPPQ
jgi:NAD-dependent DNA ligase